MTTYYLNALLCRHPDVVRYLLDQGADPTIVDANFQTCLHHAAAGASAECIAQLLTHTMTLAPQSDVLSSHRHQKSSSYGGNGSKCFPVPLKNVTVLDARGTWTR